ncbi:MAG: 30S ribosomal protein S2 [Propionibacteriaceae bacterium]|nr:30S ribosomal protein S2 [Propionibacteriaceae bacterium]
MAAVTVRQLLDNGVHFGHQTRRWNPKMKRFIFNDRNGIYIIDVRQSIKYIEEASAFIKSVVAKGGQVLFVGTKKQAQEAIAEQATRVGMPYVDQRWLGGMLTNFATISKRTQRLKELEAMDLETVTAGGLTKKELLGMRREKDKLALSLGGIKDMARLPQAIWVVDTIKEHLAIDEARKLGIPVVAILDTNCDPDEVDFPIPGNDDAIRATALLTKLMADAVADGLVARSTGGVAEVEAEPMPDWERELLVAEAPAAQAAAVAEPVVEEVVIAEAPVEIVAEPVEIVAEPVVVAEPAEPAKAEYGDGSYCGDNPPEGYDIKGNEDSMKFHTPESPWYSRTVAEVWFNSVAAAEAAGFVSAHGDTAAEQD